MPESKHRRKGKPRPRPTKSQPPEKKPDPSPRWLPVTGVGLLIGGVIVILLGYLPWIQDNLTGGLPGLGANWPLVGGFVVLASGFGLLTQWR